MDVIVGAAPFQAVVDAARSDARSVGLVPTMGALHAGHDALIRSALDDRDVVAVSIFVNPLQFTGGEDLERYPRPLETDLARCERLGVDVVWTPGVEDVYPPGVELAAPDPGPIGHLFEGAARPGHFEGVLRVVHRLLDVTGPCAAYFGEKDAQQLFLIRRMVAEERLPVQVVGRPVVREPSGLAASSRNAVLSEEERDQASSLFLGLSEAAALARAGERGAAVLVAAIAREVGAAPLARLDYVAVVGEAGFEMLDVVDRPARALVAARFTAARLIDNLSLPEPAA